jgi:hypothetical protein
MQQRDYLICHYDTLVIMISVGLNTSRPEVKKEEEVGGSRESGLSDSKCQSGIHFGDNSDLMVP